MSVLNRISKYLKEEEILPKSFDTRNIENETKENDNFRKILFTTGMLQLALMSIEPGGDTGMEMHPDVDQFIRFESGIGEMVIENEHIQVTAGTSVIVVRGNHHNIINISDKEPLKLYTVYTPPNHPDGIIYKTKEEDMAAEKEEKEIEY
jgi:mannose-6-phosphate isomerase-like protein (cupin superfamily)